MTDRRALAAALLVAGIAAVSAFADADFGAAPRALPPPSFAAWSVWFAHVGPGAGLDAMLRAALGTLPFPLHLSTALAAISLLFVAVLRLARRSGPVAAYALALLPAVHSAAALPAVALALWLFARCLRGPGFAPSNGLPSSPLGASFAVRSGSTLASLALSVLSPAAAVALWATPMPVAARFGALLGSGLTLGLDLLQRDRRLAPSGQWSDLLDQLDSAVVFADRAPALAALLCITVLSRRGSTLLRLGAALALTALDLRLDGPLDLPLHDHLAAAGLGLDLLVVAELGAFFAGRVEGTGAIASGRSDDADTPPTAHPSPQPRAVLIAFALLAGAQSAVFADRAARTWQKPTLGLGVDPDPSWSFGVQMGARGFAARTDLCPTLGAAAHRCRRGLAAGLGWRVAGQSLADGQSPRAELERLGDVLVTLYGDPELRREIHFGFGLRLAELRAGFVQPLLPLCRRDPEVALDRRDWCEMGAAFGSLRDSEDAVEHLAWALPAIEEGGRPLYARALGLWAALLGSAPSDGCWGRLPAAWSTLCGRGFLQLDRGGPPGGSGP